MLEKKKAAEFLWDTAVGKGEQVWRKRQGKRKKSRQNDEIHEKFKQICKQNRESDCILVYYHVQYRLK